MFHFFTEFPNAFGLLESVFRAIVNRLRSCPPCFLSAVFMAVWRACTPFFLADWPEFFGQEVIVEKITI